MAGIDQYINSDNIALNIADEIVGAPSAKSTAARYNCNTRKYVKLLQEMDIDPDNMDTSGSRDKSKDAVSAALTLIMERCGPKSQGIEGLGAKSTGESIKSAIVAFWVSKKRSTIYSESPDESFSGNPGTAPSVTDLIKRLHVHQLRSGLHCEQKNITGNLRFRSYYYERKLR